MRIPLPRTLLWRFCLALIVIQAVVVFTIGWFTWRSARALHYEQTLHHLERTTPLLAATYLELLDRGEVNELDERVKRDGRDGKLRITVIASDGVVLADSHSDPVRMENHSDRPEVVAARNASVGTAIRYSDSVHMNMLYLTRQYGRGDSGVTLRTALPLAAVRADLQRVLSTVAVAGGASMLLTLGLGYLVSRHLSSTVASLADRAKEFATHAPQDSSAGSLHAASVRELQPAVDAINGLAGRLHRRIQQLQVQQREHEAILQSMNCGIIVLDPQQRVVRTNRAADEMLGITASDESTSGRLLMEVSRQPELHEYVEVAMRRGENGISPAELRLRQPGRTIQASAGAMTDAAGRPAGVLLVLNDLTPLRRLESMRSDFAANVSHELRTPITNIKGYVETLLDVGFKDAEQARQFLEIIKRNSDRLGAIIEDILSLAWLEQPGTRETLGKEHVAVRMITSSVVCEFSNAAEAKSIKLCEQVPEELHARVNSPLVEQAVANYVSNAIKYSPPGTSVTIRAQQTTAADGEAVVEIAVRDQGQGIASEHLPRIFERFYRVDKARSRELGGTGLGLAIVKHIALIHGGRVAVESRVGKGSTFKLILPV